MILGVHLGVALATGYAVFLVSAALLLQASAKFAHRRSERFRVAGFRYDHAHDHWECPSGKLLVRIPTEPRKRTALYSASPHHCNCCHRKPDCTDSDTGRTIERSLDSWLDSEIRRFHLGIAMALLILAALILIFEMAAYSASRDRSVLALALAGIVLLIFRVAPRLFAGPAARASENHR